MLLSNYRQLLPWALLLCMGLMAYDLWHTQNQLTQRLVTSQKELAQIDSISRQYLAIAGPNSTALQTISDIQQGSDWLLTKAKQQGLVININPSRETSTGAKEIDVSFDKAHFNRLLQWLQKTNSETNLRVSESTIRAHLEAGKVDATFTFEMP